MWLWAVASTLLLFVLELVLFASFIPSDWAHGVEQTERRELVETLGADAAQAIVARGARWYDTLFVQTGIAIGANSSRPTISQSASRIRSAV